MIGTKAAITVRAIILFFALTVTYTAKAEDSLRVNYVLMNTTLAIDWLQTREISRNPNFFELNPILGKYPSKRDVDLYFLTATILINVGARALPPKYERHFINAVSTIQLFTIGRNAALGVNLRF